MSAGPGDGADPLAEFRPFVEVHAEFLEALLRHQERLVRGDVRAAREAVEALRRDLTAHIDREEARVLPVLEARGGWGRTGDPRFYRDEHAKIREHLDRWCDATARLDATAPGFARAVALQIGAQHAFRTLLEHHDERERTALYPDLVRVTSRAERLAMLA